MKRATDLFAIFLLTVFLLNVHPAVSAPQVDPTPPPDDQNEILAVESKFRQALEQNKEFILPLLLHETRIDGTQISSNGGYAFAWLTPLDSQTGDVIPAEPGLALAKKVATDDWQVFLQTDPLWIDVLSTTPEDLITDSTRQEWLDMYQDYTLKEDVGPWGGYLLPWAGGQSLYLSGSTFHDSYITSKSAHYAFDFSKAGVEMFNVYASKPGRVWRAVWEYPNGNEANSNYIVLEDTSTDPVSYQLYLHLAQDSIPPELRLRGALVQQGQFIGIADDTGASTANHLHFQVHLNPDSYWGQSVDITFDEVAINGGRPRRFDRDLRWCTYPEDVCEQSQLTYISRNIVRDDLDAPVGDLLVPFEDGEVNSTASMHIEGWALDEKSGLASVQILARWNGIWHEVGPELTESLFSYEWDLCSSDVPVGPLSLALRLTDYAYNVTPELVGLRQAINNYSCPPDPPACPVTADKVALYAESDYGGECVLLPIGEYPNGTALGILGDRNTASIQVGASVRATIFTLPDYAGRSETISSNDANLSDNRIGADTISSLRVRSTSASPLVPSTTWPISSTVFNSGESYSMVWSDSGGGEEFQVRLISGTQTIASPWLTQPVWHLDSYNFRSEQQPEWQVRARNSAGSTAWSGLQSFSIQAEAEYTPTIINSLPYTDDFETNAWEWRSSENWTLVDDSSQVRSGSHGWVFSITDDASPASGSLTSPLLELPANGNFALRFHYRYTTEGPGTHWDQRWLQISMDGGPYENVLQLSDDQPGAWLQSQPLDMTNYLGHRLRIRFYFVTLDALANDSLTWAVDDLTINEPPQVNCSGDTEPNDTYINAQQLNIGEWVSGRICPAGDMDYFKFTASAGDRIAIDVDAKSTGSLLDSLIYLLDSDGSSPLAENDDEVLYERPDSHLGYQFARSGTYYIILRAWDHPSVGSENHFYTIKLIQDQLAPTTNILSPQNQGIIPMPNPVITATADDSGSGISHVKFWWHANEWQVTDWQVIGEDWNGADGWSIPFDTSRLNDQTGSAIIILAYDWAGNTTATGAWGLTLDLQAPQTSMEELPATVGSSAIQLFWDSSDNLSGLDRFDVQARQSGESSWEEPDYYSSDTKYAWYIGEPGATVEFRMRGIDKAGNSEAYDILPETYTQIRNCSQPDNWDSTPDDDDFSRAVLVSPGAPSQIRNLCNLGDEDWLKMNLVAGHTYRFLSIPLNPSTAVVFQLYSRNSETLLEVASAVPDQFPAITRLLFTPTNDGQYYLKVSHIDARIAGDDVSYRLFVSQPNDIYMPLLGR